MQNLQQFDLVEKYSGNVPRYTSYPPVPSWNGAPTEEAWFSGIREAVQRDPEAGIALYIHLPFCEQLCTYCACNKRITANHGVESPYIEDLRKEWSLYRKHLDVPIKLSELHLGGGTPTFFSAANLDRLLTFLLNEVEVATNASLSVEVHPNNTTREQLEVLYKHGFRRISIGVQSLDHTVQHLINRIQPMERVHAVSEMARKLGYTSINVDVIYGLPYQNTDVVKRDIEAILELRPDRVAHYGYAHVPWKHAGQRRYTETDLPRGRVRFESAELARMRFLQAGYVEIGMDHYALPNDSLAIAAKSGYLHRNFMGYTDKRPNVLIGLGASSISESPFGLVQNEKHIEAYRDKLTQGESLFITGHTFTAEDHMMRRLVLDLMCGLESALPAGCDDDVLEQLSSMEKDQIIKVNNKKLKVNPNARPFLRSVCKVFDPHFRTLENRQQYSSNL